MRAIIGVLALFVTLSAHAFSLDNLSTKDTAGGLKEALQQGAITAVGNLGKTDGFLGNPQVKIELPDNIKKIESVLRTFGGSKYADELIIGMNRAAEAAVPEAKTLLVSAIKNMSVKDAKGILTGGDDAATQYFRRTTSEQLTAKFKPVVQKAMRNVKVAEKYDALASKAASYGLLNQKDAHLDDYVTAKTLDGLFSMIAEQEKSIRQNPVGAAGNLAKKVFGVLK